MKFLRGFVFVFGVVFLFSACGGDPLSSGGGGFVSGGGVVVGSAAFPESQVVAEIYAAALNGGGVKASTKVNLGSREVYVPALQDGSIGVVPEYSGNLLAFFDSGAVYSSAEDVMLALGGVVPEGLAVLDASFAENKDALVVTREVSQEYGLTSLADIGVLCGGFVFAGQPEFSERGYGLPGLLENYGCVPKSFEPINDGGGFATVKALVDGRVQVANVFTTSFAIGDNDFVVLDDPKNNFVAQQLVPLVRSDLVGGVAVDILNRVSARLSTLDLVELNRQVSGDLKVDPVVAASVWVEANGFGG